MRSETRSTYVLFPPFDIICTIASVVPAASQWRGLAEETQWNFPEAKRKSSLVSLHFCFEINEHESPKGIWQHVWIPADAEKLPS